MTTQTPIAQWQENFISYIKANYQIIYIKSSEEARVEKTIYDTLQTLNAVRRERLRPNIELVTWDITAGFDYYQKDQSSPTIKNEAVDMTARGALNKIQNTSIAMPQHAIFVLRDFDDSLGDVHVRRKLQSISEQRLLGATETSTKILVILSSKLEVPDKLKHHIANAEFPLPDESIIQSRIEFIKQNVSAEKRAALTPELQQELTRNLAGLTVRETDNVLSRGFVKAGSFSPAMLPVIKDEKAAAFKHNSILTYTAEDKLPNIEDIGGYDNLFAWIDRVKLSFSKEAREAQIDASRGIGLLGFPGTCKSVCAKGIAKLLNLPCLSMDFGSVFGSKVGESESRLRGALAQVDALDGSVLLIDEVDKMLGGANDSSGDSGVTRRVFGSLLTWMAEKTSNTFVVFTMNRMDSLPPELTRAGRLDKLWFVDMPDATVRRKILDIHFRKRGVDPADLKLTEDQWARIDSLTSNFIGAEVERVVVESRNLSFSKRQSGLPTFQEIEQASQEIISLWSREQDQMMKFKKTLEGVATPVYLPVQEKQTARVRRATRVIDN